MSFTCHTNLEHSFSNFTSKSQVWFFFQVDQLVKFNQSLIDNSSASAGTKSVIDGILLTKFDCIDDKVSKIVCV